MKPRVLVMNLEPTPQYLLLSAAASLYCFIMSDYLLVGNPSTLDIVLTYGLKIFGIGASITTIVTGYFKIEKQLKRKYRSVVKVVRTAGKEIVNIFKSKEE